MKTAYCNDILSHLRVLRIPTVKLVVAHFQNISLQLEEKNDSDLMPTQADTRISVMRAIYRFLCVKANSNTAVKEQLQHIPSILVKDGGRFVHAKQVVIELVENLEIPPFLYRMPAELSEFSSLFKYLGCSPSVTPSHYAMVLDMLHGRCKANRLDSDDLDSALKAVKGLFETLQDSPVAKQDMPTLFLPATCPFSSIPEHTMQHVVLTKATELIFDDAPLYCGRIQDFNLSFVMGLKRANVCCKASANYEELIMLLPIAVCPQMMSCVIQEKFTNSDSSTKRFDVSATSALENQLHSEQFYRGIVRLIRHANQDSGLDDSVIATVKSSLRSIEFLGMSKIITHLVHRGIVIPGSELEVPYFLEKVVESGVEICKVYFNAVEDTEETISTIAITLAQVIDEAWQRTNAKHSPVHS